MTITSNTYRLEELVQSAENGIKTVNEVLVQQRELLDIVKNAKKKHINADFIEGLEESIKNLETRKAGYELDRAFMKDILDRVKAHEKDEFNELDAVVTMMLHLFTDIKIEEKAE